MAEETIGNYRLLNCMFTGQVSQVWEVVETSSHRHFAMKLLLRARGHDAESKRMLYHEAKVGKELTREYYVNYANMREDVFEQLCRANPAVFAAAAAESLLGAVAGSPPPRAEAAATTAPAPAREGVGAPGGVGAAVEAGPGAARSAVSVL